MRALFARQLHKFLADTPTARLLTADIGYGVLDAVLVDHRHQCVDFSSAEQLMIGAAAGMSLSGLIPICYTITPFLLCRPFEWLRTFCKFDRIPLRLVGVGRADEYKLGNTHNAYDAEAICNLLGIQYLLPDDETLPAAIDILFNSRIPSFLHLSRK